MENPVSTKFCLQEISWHILSMSRNTGAPPRPLLPASSRDVYQDLHRDKNVKKCRKVACVLCQEKRVKVRLWGSIFVLYLQTAVCWFITLSTVHCVNVSLCLWSLQRQTSQDSLEEYPGIADAINKYIAAWHWWWRSASERKHTTGRLASACCWVLAFILPQVWLILANPYIPSD